MGLNPEENIGKQNIGNRESGAAGKAIFNMLCQGAVFIWMERIKYFKFMKTTTCRYERTSYIMNTRRCL